MRKICVVSGTRAEYGLLYWTMKAIDRDPDLRLQICVTGMHLSPEFGLTFTEIEKDGFSIDAKIEMLLSSDTPTGISKSLGLGIIGFADAFANLDPDIVLLLGDRFEIFAAASAALIARIPIAHCHGGETTEGAIDEGFRHSITKMSHFHFAATDQYRARIIQLGEDAGQVYNFGALGVESIKKARLLEKTEFEESIGLKLGALNFLVTFHPVTLEENTAEAQFRELLKAIEQFPEAHVIFTKPNADTNGRPIIKLIDDFVERNSKRAVSFISLGQQRYLSALKHVDVVVGNSSSGLLEAPSFRKPTINIGDRQRGRIRASSVIDVAPLASDIVSKLKFSLSNDFRSTLERTINPYENEDASDKIVAVLKSANLENILKKKFNDNY